VNGTSVIDVYDSSPQQKAAWVAWHLALGETLTTHQVAGQFGMTWHGAHRMMCSVSGKIPIVAEDGGVWKRFDNY